MNEKQIRELLHGADDEAIRRIAQHDAPDERQKERIYQRITVAQPMQEAAESETYQVQEAGRFQWRRTAAVGLAACLMIGLGIGAASGIRRMTPNIRPGSELQETLEGSRVFTPFGDITQTQPLFQYTSDNTQAAEQALRENGNPDAHMLEERTLTQEQLAALGEVFRVYGWRDQTGENMPDTTVTDDCIVMHLYQNPESREGEYLTAYFHFDPRSEFNAERLLRVDTNGETKWYALDDEIIRCLREIIVDGQIAYYPPQELRFDKHFAELAFYDAAKGEPSTEFTVTDGQLAVLDDLLDMVPFYEWNTLRDINPCHGRSIGLVLDGEEDRKEILTFWLDTGCVEYEVQHIYGEELADAIVSATDTRHSHYWPDDDSFMQTVEQLLREGICPNGPLGAELPADMKFRCDAMHVQANESYADIPLNGTNRERLAKLFGGMTWREIACPIDVDTRTNYEDFCLHYNNGDDHTLRFYSEESFMEWNELRGGQEITHFFEMTPEVWAEVQTVWDAARTGTLPEGSQPFMDLLLSSWHQTCCIDCHGVAVAELNNRFKVELPPNDTEFTFDAFRMQELLDTVDWTPQSIPAENWKPGYVTMRLSTDESLLVSIGGYDSADRYLLRYQNGSEEPRYYFADEAFLQEFMQILAETGEVVTSEINIISACPFRGLIVDEPLYCGMGATHPLNDEARQTLLNVLDSLNWTTCQTYERDIIPDSDFILISIGTPAGTEESKDGKGTLYFCPFSNLLICEVDKGSKPTQVPLTDTQFATLATALMPYLTPMADSARAYLESVEPGAAERYTNWDNPVIEPLDVLPEGAYAPVSEPQTEQFYRVSFTPAEDAENALLGWQVLYLDAAGNVVGVGYRD